jgi:hypothetical protein
MRLSRKLVGLLAVGLTTAAAVAAAVPASANAPSPTPYWHIETSPQGYASVLCVTGALGGPLGSAVTQQNCDDTYTDTSQLWQPIAMSSGVYKFENIGTGWCLEARTGAVNGGVVALWPCTSSESNENWSWPTTSDGRSFPLMQPMQTRVSGSTGYCLDVPDAQLLAGLQMQVYRCNGTFAQLMRFYHPAG